MHIIIKIEMQLTLQDPEITPGSLNNIILLTKEVYSLLHRIMIAKSLSQFNQKKYFP